MKKVLFVCLGNICRSPAAEGIFQQMLIDNGLESSIYVDSAGTSAYHQGDKADSRMREEASRRGYQLKSLSRPFCVSDFDDFDFIIAMDESNLKNIRQSSRQESDREKIQLFSDFCEIHKYPREVPDPYWGGADGFKRVFDMLEQGCQNLISKLK